MTQEVAPMSEPQIPPNWNFIGQCYDAVYVDMYFLGDREPYPLGHAARTGTKQYSAFDLHADTVDPNHNVKIPKNTRYTPLNKTTQASSKNVVSTSYDFLQKQSTSVGLSVGVGEKYSGSASITWRSLDATSNEQRRVNTITDAVRQTYEMDLQGEESSEPSEVPPMNTDFQSSLWNAGAEGSTGEANFESFVAKYGTHFSNHTVLGGVGKQRFSLSEDSFARMEDSGIEVNTEAQATIKTVEIGGSVEHSKDLSEEWKEAISGESTEITFVGGNAELDFEAWIASVDEKPTVVGVSLIQHDQLITTGYFPSQPSDELQARADRVQQRIQLYIQSQGLDLTASTIKVGDRVFLATMPLPTGLSSSTVPPVLFQGAGDLTQTTVVQPAVASLGDFLRQPIRYAGSYWRIETVPTQPQGTDIEMGQSIRLTNLASFANLDAEAARPNYGSVSAGTGVKSVVDAGGNSSSTWSVNARLGSWGDSNRPLNSGDAIALQRLYVSPNTTYDPRGYLQARDKELFSNGLQPKGLGLLASKIAWQIVRSSTLDVSIEVGDVVCFLALPRSLSQTADAMPMSLYQPAGATSQTQVQKPAVAWTQFFQDPAAYGEYFWQVKAVASKPAGDPVTAGDLVELVNLKTSKLLDAEGAKEYYGYVSAGTGVAPIEKNSPYSSAVWQIKRHYGEGEALYSGDAISLYRMYQSPNTTYDPQGYLQCRQQLLYSNGQIPTGIDPFQAELVWQIVKAPTRVSA